METRTTEDSIATMLDLILHLEFYAFLMSTFPSPEMIPNLLASNISITKQNHSPLTELIPKLDKVIRFLEVTVFRSLVYFRLTSSISLLMNMVGGYALPIFCRTILKSVF